MTPRHSATSTALSGAFDRRSFVKAGAVAAAVAAGALHTADAAPAGRAGTIANRMQDARTGMLRWAHTDEWAGKQVLDPASPARFWETLALLYNRLVEPDESGLPVGDLATSWSSNETADEWTFTLREGVTFHDGKPFSSADVVYTLNHVVDPELGSPGASVLEILDTTALQAPDAQTVVIKLKQPHADFPMLLLHYSCYIIPEGSAETIGTTGIGTGPFRLQSFDPTGVTTLVANETYWEGTPALQEISLVGIADANARVDALLGGQIDYLDAVEGGAALTIAQNSDFVIHELPSGDWVTLVMRCNAAPFDKPQVRQAFKLVVDRAAVVQAVLQGQGTPANDHPVWAGDPYQLTEERPQDIAQAKALLAEAGYPDGLKVELHTSDIQSPMSSLAVVYKEMAKEAGIEVDIIQSPADGYWNDVWLIEPFCTSSWGQRPADQVLNEVFRSGASWNESAWENPEFDALIDAARKELDLAARTALYQDAQRLLMNDSGDIIPFFTNSLRALSTRIRNFEPTQNYVNWFTIAID